MKTIISLTQKQKLIVLTVVAGLIFIFAAVWAAWTASQSYGTFTIIEKDILMSEEIEIELEDHWLDVFPSPIQVWYSDTEVELGGIFGATYSEFIFLVSEKHDGERISLSFTVNKTLLDKEENKFYEDFINQEELDGEITYDNGFDVVLDDKDGTLQLVVDPDHIGEPMYKMTIKHWPNAKNCDLLDGGMNLNLGCIDGDIVIEVIVSPDYYETMLLHVAPDFVRKPLITVNDQLPREFEAGSESPIFSDYVSAYDNVDGDIFGIDSRFEIDNTSVDMNTPGSFSIEYHVSDNAGNKSDATVVIFTIIDTTSPELLFNGATVEAGLWESIDWTDLLNLEVQTTDNSCIAGLDCIMLIEDVTSLDDPIIYDVVGIYTLQLRITDPSGNATTITAPIVVEDSTPPDFDFEVPGSFALTILAGEIDWTNYMTNLYDTIPGVLTSAMVSDGIIYGTPGIYIVQLSLTDLSGNITVKDVYVTIE